MGSNYHTSWTTASLFHADDMNPPLSTLDAAITMIHGNLLQSGGFFGWDSTAGTLSWTLPLQILVIDPFGKMCLNECASGNITIPASNYAYISLSTVNNATVSATYSSFSTASTVLTPYNRFILGAVNTALEFYPKEIIPHLKSILNSDSTYVYQHQIDSSSMHSGTATEGEILIASSASLPIGSGLALTAVTSTIAGLQTNKQGAQESSVTCASTFTIDFTDAETRFLTLTTNASAIVTGGVNGHTYYIRIQQDATGNWTLALGATANSIRWVGGAAPTITTSATVSDLITLKRSNGTWFGSYLQNF